MGRIAGIDFGLKRVGIALSDELHISVSPQPTLLYEATDFWEKLLAVFADENVEAVVVGTPYLDDEDHPMREPIEQFISDLSERTPLPLHTQDESYSSANAVNVMLEISKKKKKRATKGVTDGIAAALILEDYLYSIKV
ncbi:MAG: Holliday junction resolvase RuvX [Ignavibacteria bacterium]|jgi:putative Holliday junction resolvase|nr:Holliday junction resolvase RuvX [Ignavibacteria bacterium]